MIQFSLNMLGSKVSGINSIVWCCCSYCFVLFWVLFVCLFVCLFFVIFFLGGGGYIMSVAIYNNNMFLLYTKSNTAMEYKTNINCTHTSLENQHVNAHYDSVNSHSQIDMYYEITS